jgi:hypothetical protein
MAVKIKRKSNKTSVYKAFDLWIENCVERGLKPASVETYKEKGMEFLEYR